MDDTMDNQQVTPVVLAWFAGIIDGEGTINITKKPTRKRVDGSVRYNYWTFLQIANTDENLILRCIDIMKRLGSNPYVWEKPATEKWKKAYQISLQNMNKTYRVLKAVHPYLVSKRRHSELVMAFVESRISKYEKGRGKNNPYSLEELEMITEIKRLNHRGNLRDFTPETK